MTDEARAPRRPDPRRLERILDFLFLADRMKTTYRAGYLADGSRRESDAEHMWHLGLHAILLRGEIGFDTDMSRVLCLVLTHDLVELYAGDTYAYDAKAVEGQDEREMEAAKRLFATLPDDLGKRLFDYWREFEEGATPDARFAKALDRLQGFSQNVNSGGRAWRENRVTKERTSLRTTLPSQTDPALAELVRILYGRTDIPGFWPDA
jgi:putative hydrolase of HD superfamily